MRVIQNSKPMTYYRYRLLKLLDCSYKRNLLVSYMTAKRAGINAYFGNSTHSLWQKPLRELLSGVCFPFILCSYIGMTKLQSQQYSPFLDIPYFLC